MHMLASAGIFLVAAVAAGLSSLLFHATEETGTYSDICGETGVNEVTQLDNVTPELPFVFTSGSKTYVCGDGTIAAHAASTSDDGWWRIHTKSDSWKHPLVTACLTPLGFDSFTREPWYNVLGILAPYESDERNYATSYRYDAQVVVKKEMTGYTNLSRYLSIPQGVPFETPVGMTVSVTEGTTSTIIRTWVSVGDCYPNTSEPPNLVGHDTSDEPITKGALALRTDHLSHQLLVWEACEATDDGTSCAGEKTVFVPVADE